MATETPEEEEFFRKEKKKARIADSSSDLNINSLMDIMTILLVFLLVSITSDPLNVKQDDFLLLAKSTADYDPADSITVTITKDKMIVDNKYTVVKVDCTTPGGQICQKEDYKEPGNKYSVDKSFKEDGSESSFMIVPLFKKLDELVKESKDLARELGDEAEFKGILTIICDRDIPFRMIAELVHTSGMAGLSDLRFAILKAGDR